MKVLAIIPARGGSKGVPKKNIKIIDGKPLIAYTIETAKKSKLLSKVIVSTDSEEIIDVVKSYNCEVLKRSSTTAKDNSTIDSVLLEILNEIDEDYDVLMLLQPTAPIREAEDIDNVIKMFSEDNSTQCVVSVVELNDIHPARMYTLDNSLTMMPLEENGERKRRQDLSKVYLRNGSIYAVKRNAFEIQKKLIQEEKKAYVMPESSWANIDTERDFLITEVLIQQWKKERL